MRHNVPVGICGEMGGRALEAMALIGIGLDRFSITPAAVGPIKAMIRSLDRGAVMAEVDRLLAKPPADMRARPRPLGRQDGGCDRLSRPFRAGSRKVARLTSAPAIFEG